MRLKGGSIWAGYSTPYDKLVYGVQVAQEYLRYNTTLGIPALIQSEGLHGLTLNGTIFPSPIALGALFDAELVKQVAGVVANESEGLGTALQPLFSLFSLNMLQASHTYLLLFLILGEVCLLRMIRCIDLTK